MKEAAACQTFTRFNKVKLSGRLCLLSCCFQALQSFNEQYEGAVDNRLLHWFCKSMQTDSVTSCFKHCWTLCSAEMSKTKPEACFCLSDQQRPASSAAWFYWKTSGLKLTSTNLMQTAESLHWFCWFAPGIKMPHKLSEVLLNLEDKSDSKWECTF